MLKNKNVAAKWVAFVVQITVVMKIHSHSAVLAVAFQCWTGGKEEIWGLWLRACFITNDPKELCKAMLKIQTRCAVPSLAEEQMQSWQRWSHLGKANPHDVLGHHVGPPGCRNFGQRKAWAGRRSGQLMRQAEAEAFELRNMSSSHMKKMQEPLPACQGHRPWPQQWSEVVSLSHARKARWEEKSTAAEQIPPRAVSDSGLLLGIHHRFLNQASSRSHSHQGRSSKFNFSLHPWCVSFPFIFNLNFM